MGVESRTIVQLFPALAEGLILSNEKPDTFRSPSSEACVKQLLRLTKWSDLLRFLIYERFGIPQLIIILADLKEDQQSERKIMLSR